MTWQASGPFDSELEARAEAGRWSDPTADVDEETAYHMRHQPEFYRAGLRDARKHRLWEAFERTGIDTGRYDGELGMWVQDWEIASVEVVASLIERAYEAGRGDRD